MLIKRILILSSLSWVMSSCAVIAVGAVAGVAGTTAVVATDPRTAGAVVEDNTIEVKLKHRYSGYANSNIYANSYNGNVLLTGQIPDANTRESAIFAAKVTPGVKQIYNYLETRLPQSFTGTTTDTYTTTQVRAKILQLKDIDSNSIKVVTTNDVVYLLGIVTEAQASQISNAASSIGGVKKVVTLFQYVTSK
jgi:osmotically-inducible protein OsmY